MEAPDKMPTVDELWDALRAVTCVTHPYTDAKTIVGLRREDVVKAHKYLLTK